VDVVLNSKVLKFQPSPTVYSIESTPIERILEYEYLGTEIRAASLSLPSRKLFWITEIQSVYSSAQIIYHQ